MMMFAKKPSSSAPSSAPKPASQHAAKIPPVSPRSMRSAMSPKSRVKSALTYWKGL